MPGVPLRIVTPILCCLLYGAGAFAQSAPKALRLPQAERLAIELRQGMTLAEVEKLLGKPRRTALKADLYASAASASAGTLQWTYAWAGGPRVERTLQVTFLSGAPHLWRVSGWDWGGD
jgi:hypothetical protein